MKANTKEWIQYGSACAMIISGIVLAFLSFFIKGDVTDGVLLYIAQALTFAGGVFGISLYFKTKLGVAENHVHEYIDNRLNDYERRRSQQHEDNAQSQEPIGA